MPTMSESFHPAIVIAALGMLTALILLITVFRLRSLGLKILLLLVAIAVLAPAGFVVLTVYPEWVDGRFRTYKDFYNDIRLGMTRDEVMKTLAGHYPEGGERQPPFIMVDEVDSLTFFMHPEDPGRPVGSEGILLGLQDGKVVSKTYSPD